MKLVFKHIACIGIYFWLLPLSAQNDFYSTNYIAEVKLYFKEANWDNILDSLYAANERERLIGDVKINGTLYKNAGIRYKGYSSASLNRVKNPFNIKLDYVENNQNHEGFTKLKLSNVIHDPSFIREVLSYEIARNYMPASRANFANVYVNDTLIGLYSNIESVESNFLSNHFGSSNHAFFKGNPTSLDLNGENSNLSNSHGETSEFYKPYYNRKSKNLDDWNVFYDFISILNSNPDQLNNFLNIDRALWMHAFNYALINFDSYIGYAQNYYLYQNEAGQFNPILWDLNQSFASYRLTDASVYWQGFSVIEAPKLDPLTHLINFSVYPRPLMTNLFSNSTYKKMYLAHLRSILEENFLNQFYYQRALTLQDLIKNSVIADTNKFYSTNQFIKNLDSTVTDFIEYPGIAELMKNRSDYLSSYYGIKGVPKITNVTNKNYTFGEAITFKAIVTDGNEAYINYRYSENDKFIQLKLNDNGLNGDELAGDNVFSINLNNASNFIQYYFYAQNDSAGRFLPKRAAYEYFSMTSKLPHQALVINELKAENSGPYHDEQDEFEDWIELYNTTKTSISTDSLFLINSLNNSLSFQRIKKTIPPNGYLMLWADNETNEGSTHVNFKLNSNGEFIGLLDSENNFSDSVTFGKQNNAFSFGRYPNGTGEFKDMYASYNAKNNEPTEGVFTSSLFLFPNPTQNHIFVQSTLAPPYSARITTITGSYISEIELSENGTKIDTEHLSDGVYILTLQKGGVTTEPKKLIINH